MAGLSLQCGDCGASLRTVEEAQEHAEVTGHAKFVESTEAVLNLVCTSCGKPCRSKTETDLHTKRTGHTDFSDKTAESSSPIDLQAKPQPMDVDQPVVEMVAPDVNSKTLDELLAMGFPRNRAIRGLHATGNSDSMETVINWIVEHESDENIDEELLVPSSEQAPKLVLSAEEAKAKAAELVERARKKKEEEERVNEREREKERIRMGKELLEAKRKEEDSERKRMITYRKAQKEEEQRAREKIRLKIEEDKAERRRKLGLPPEEPKSSSSASSVPEVKVQDPSPVVVSSSLAVVKASKADEMRSCLRSIKQAHKDEDARVKKAFQTLQTYVANVGRAPSEEKFRKIRVTNAAFQERVGGVGGGQFLELCGFEADGSGEFLYLPENRVDMQVLKTADRELNSAVSNPFFGVL